MTGPVLVKNFKQKSGMCYALANSWCVLRLNGYSNDEIISYFDKRPAVTYFEHKTNKQLSSHQEAKMRGRSMEYGNRFTRKAMKSHTHTTVIEDESDLKGFEYHLKGKSKIDLIKQSNKDLKKNRNNNATMLADSSARLESIVRSLNQNEPKAVAIGFFCWAYSIKTHQQEQHGHEFGLFLNNGFALNGNGYPREHRECELFDPNSGVYRIKQNKIAKVLFTKILDDYLWGRVIKDPSLRAPYLLKSIQFGHISAKEIDGKQTADFVQKYIKFAAKDSKAKRLDR